MSATDKPTNADRQQLSYLAEQCRRATGADRTIVLVVREGRHNALSAGYAQSNAAHAVAEVAMDLLLAVAAILPPGITLQVRDPRGECTDVPQGGVDGVIREYLDPAAWNTGAAADPVWPRCIACGCDEMHACEDSDHPGRGCHWLVLNEDMGAGLCSECGPRILAESEGR